MLILQVVCTADWTDGASSFIGKSTFGKADSVWTQSFISEGGVGVMSVLFIHTQTLSADRLPSHLMICLSM